MDDVPSCGGDGRHVGGRGRTRACPACTALAAPVTLWGWRVCTPIYIGGGCSRMQRSWVHTHALPCMSRPAAASWLRRLGRGEAGAQRLLMRQCAATPHLDLCSNMRDTIHHLEECSALSSYWRASRQALPFGGTRRVISLASQAHSQRQMHLPACLPAWDAGGGRGRAHVLPVIGTGAASHCVARCRVVRALMLLLDLQGGIGNPHESCRYLYVCVRVACETLRPAVYVVGINDVGMPLGGAASSCTPRVMGTSAGVLLQAGRELLRTVHSGRRAATTGHWSSTWS